jgi:hypothetical protein
LNPLQRRSGFTDFFDGVLKGPMMITVTKSSDDKVATVSGSECEVMLFYCFWQWKLWPEWMNHAKLGQDSDVATMQHRSVVRNVNSGLPLLLSDVGEYFEAACQFAIERCRLLGIEVFDASGAN